MYGLSSDIDLGFLSGLEVTSADRTEYQTQIRLGDSVEISAESTVSLNGEPLNEDSETQLALLVGLKITSAHVQGRGDLVLGFNDGRELTIHDDLDDYESYTLTGPDGVIVV